MAVSTGYQTFVLDQLGRVLPAVRARRMFGGVGLYAGELFFALIDDDTLYLKVDDTNRADFEARGMGPFQPYGEGTPSMQYYQLPEEIFEDAVGLREWAERALEVARRAKATRVGGKGAPRAKRDAKAKAATKPKRGAKAKPASKPKPASKATRKRPPR